MTSVENKDTNDKKNIEKLMKQDYSYPETDDKELQLKLYGKREFYYHASRERPIVEDYNDVKEYRDDICARNFQLQEHQSLLSNFINTSTPYAGLVLFHGVGTGKCIGSDALVLVNGTLTRIEDIWNANFTHITKDSEGGIWSLPKKELEVNSYDEKTGKMFKNKVDKLYKEKINSELRKITLDNGSVLEITDAHKLLTAKGWTNILSTGDYICVPKIVYNCETNTKLQVTKELSYLLGWQISEGHERSDQYTVLITQDDTKILEKINDAVAKVGTHYKINFNVPKIHKSKDRSSYLQINSKEYIDFLKKYGYDYGNLSREKHFPDFIMNMSKDNLKIFLKAYFDGEASVSIKNKVIEIASASKLVIKQLETLLKIFGIYFRIKTKMKSATNGKNIKKEYYYGYISSDDLVIFQKEIGFSVDYKVSNLETISSKKHNTNVKVIPITEKLDDIYTKTQLPKRRFIDFRYLKSKQVEQHTLQQPSKDMLVKTYGNLNLVLDDKSFLKKNNIDKSKQLFIKKSSDELKFESEKEIIYAKIVKIERVKYNGYVYDLEIKDVHNYVAENFIAHNTCSAISIAENFKTQCSKYGTKIIVLVGGPLIKENWKNELLKCTGETYMKYQDKSVYMDDMEKSKQEKNALIQALQYYKFMSYKSFYKHVIGEKITDRQGDKKVKATYRKTDEGEFERDIAVDRIYNLNNTLIIVDEAHNLTGNSYGEALKYIIKNSSNLKLLLLSATPMKNLGSDIVELVNFLRPLDSQINRDKIFNSNKGHLMEFKDGGIDYLKKMMRGYISHIRGADPLTFAKRFDKGIKPDGLLFTKVIRCHMLKFQRTTYDKAILENEEDTLDRKSEAVANFVFPGLTSDRKELMGYYAGEGVGLVKNQLKVNGEQINKKLSNLLFGHDQEKDLIYVTEDGRSVTGKILRMPYLKYFSVKFYKCMKKLNRLVWGKKGPSTAFVYSNLVKVGIALFHEILVQNGYLEFQDDSTNYQIGPNTVCYFCGRPHSEHKGGLVETEELATDSASSSSDESVISEINMSSTSSDYRETATTKWEKKIPPHVFRPATFISITGKSSEESMEALPEDKKRVLDSAFNNVENRDGRYIKFVLGSRVMNEGISLRNVGEVHILDAYFNFGRVDQVIGRAIRHCSHYKVMSRENPYPIVNVYKYVVAVEEGLSTEEELYKKAEMKYLLIKKIERAMKEVAIDCPLNIHSNMFKEEIEQYKTCGENDPQNPCPAICDYTKCSYKCDDEKLNAQYYDPNRGIYKKIPKDKLDYSTFTHGLARNEIDYAKDKIKEMYITGYMYTLENILEYVKNTYTDEKRELFDEFFVFKALDELIPITENDFNNYRDTIIDKMNRSGYLIYINIHYIFQPFDENELVPMYYRTTMVKHVNQSLSLYNYLKTNPVYQQFKENKGKRRKDNEKEIRDDQPFYDFESAMEYYDSREEYEIVGYIDREASRRKNKSADEVKDVFKLRERRAKILEKKREKGLNSFSGSVCISSKSKRYLEKTLAKLGIPKSNVKTRSDICDRIEEKLLLLEKYATDADKNKFTYVIIPVNNPKYSWPLNLEDRVAHRIEKIKAEISNKVDVVVKKIKKTSGKELGLPSYELRIKDDDKVKEHHDILDKMKAVKQGKEFVILLE